jgi:hypothetical protein
MTTPTTPNSLSQSILQDLEHRLHFEQLLVSTRTRSVQPLKPLLEEQFSSRWLCLEAEEEESSHTTGQTTFVQMTMEQQIQEEQHDYAFLASSSSWTIQ